MSQPLNMERITLISAWASEGRSMSEIATLLGKAEGRAFTRSAIAGYIKRARERGVAISGRDEPETKREAEAKNRNAMIELVARLADGSRTSAQITSTLRISGHDVSENAVRTWLRLAKEKGHRVKMSPALSSKPRPQPRAAMKDPGPGKDAGSDPHACRYIYGEGRTRVFCNRPVGFGESWCTMHHSRVFVRPDVTRNVMRDTDRAALWAVRQA